MIIRHFSYQQLVCIASSTPLRMIVTASLTRREPGSEGDTQDSPDTEYRGPSTDHICSSTESTAAPFPGMGRADADYDPATQAPVDHPTG